ncbi:alpha/beta fold hydrolase [Nonomuraea sp. LPB2021202275-12-8]|uniref:alpha/beta fold hydrolase n=1 Tax=Nonomuraea sp. LPB2021202275-12-8 TaxID=3120159 RepID=UPI00300C1A74
MGAQGAGSRRHGLLPHHPPGQSQDEPARPPVPGRPCGHSLGGAIALACDSPRIAARVLISTGGLTRLQVGPAMLAATMLWMARPSQAHSAALLRRFVAPDSTPPATLIDWYTLVARHCRSSLAPPALRPETLQRCRSVPCLVATGEHDAFLPPRRLRPAAQRHLATSLRVIPATGHLVTDEQPQQITALLDEISALLTGPQSAA